MEWIAQKSMMGLIMNTIVHLHLNFHILISPYPLIPDSNLTFHKNTGYNNSQSSST